MLRERGDSAGASLSVGRLKQSSDRGVFFLRTLNAARRSQQPATPHIFLLKAGRRCDLPPLVLGCWAVEPKSASEKYDPVAELGLNMESNQLQLIMSNQKALFIYFRPLGCFISAGITVQTHHWPVCVCSSLASLVIYVAQGGDTERVGRAESTASHLSRSRWSSVVDSPERLALLSKPLVNPL